MNQKMKKIKPKNLSCNLIYECEDCSREHWVSLQAAKTTGYMIVCECGSSYKTQPVQGIKILYKKKKKPVQPAEQSKEGVVQQASSMSPELELNDNTLNICVNTLAGYGYTNAESKNIVISAYSNSKTNQVSELIKSCFQVIGESVK